MWKQYVSNSPDCIGLILHEWSFRTASSYRSVSNIKWLVARRDNCRKTSFPPVAGAVAAFICMQRRLISINQRVRWGNRSTVPSGFSSVPNWKWNWKTNMKQTTGVLKASWPSPDLEPADGLFRDIPSKQRFLWDPEMHFFSSLPRVQQK